MLLATTGACTRKGADPERPAPFLHPILWHVACAASNTTVCLDATPKDCPLPFPPVRAGLVASCSAPRDSVPTPHACWDQDAVGCLVRRCAWPGSTRRRDSQVRASTPVSFDRAHRSIRTSGQQPKAAITPGGRSMSSGADLVPPTRTYRMYQVIRMICRRVSRIQRLIHHVLCAQPTSRGQCGAPALHDGL